MNNIELSKQEFSRKIENYIEINKSSYIDATVAISEIENLDYSIIAKLLTRPILEKIQEEGRGLNLLPKSKYRSGEFPYQ